MAGAATHPRTQVAAPASTQRWHAGREFVVSGLLTCSLSTSRPRGMHMRLGSHIRLAPPSGLAIALPAAKFCLRFGNLFQHGGRFFLFGGPQRFQLCIEDDQDEVFLCNDLCICLPGLFDFRPWPRPQPRGLEVEVQLTSTTERTIGRDEAEESSERDLNARQQGGRAISRAQIPSIIPDLSGTTPLCRYKSSIPPGAATDHKPPTPTQPRLTERAERSSGAQTRPHDTAR